MFGDVLRRERERAGLSQYALAKLAGLSKQGLSHLEAGIREPGWVTVQRLALALKLSTEQLRDPALAIPEDVELREVGRPRKEPAEAVEEPKPRRGRPRKTGK